MAELVAHVRQAVRVALRKRSFVATLGVGIGASSAAFSVLNALTLKPVAYADSRRVCLLQAWDEARNRSSFAMPAGAFVALAAEAASFERVAAYRYWSVALAGEGAPERAQGYRVTGEAFPLLATPALLGRTLGPDDARPGAAGNMVSAHHRHAARATRTGTVLGMLPSQAWWLAASGLLVLTGVAVAGSMLFLGGTVRGR